MKGIEKKIAGMHINGFTVEGFEKYPLFSQCKERNFLKECTMVLLKDTSTGYVHGVDLELYIQENLYIL